MPHLNPNLAHFLIQFFLHMYRNAATKQILTVAFIVFVFGIPDRQPVGICTVQRSSDDSSVDVPMKSNVKQLRTRCNV